MERGGEWEARGPVGFTCDPGRTSGEGGLGLLSRSAPEMGEGEQYGRVMIFPKTAVHKPDCRLHSPRGPLGSCVCTALGAGLQVKM